MRVSWYGAGWEGFSTVHQGDEHFEVSCIYNLRRRGTFTLKLSSGEEGQLAPFSLCYHEPHGMYIFCIIIQRELLWNTHVQQTFSHCSSRYLCISFVLNVSSLPWPPHAPFAYLLHPGLREAKEIKIPLVFWRDLSESDSARKVLPVRSGANKNHSHQLPSDPSAENHNRPCAKPPSLPTPIPIPSHPRSIYSYPVV